MFGRKKRTRSEVETNLRSKSFLAGRVMVGSTRHTQLHGEMNDLLDEWQSLDD